MGCCWEQEMRAAQQVINIRRNACVLDLSHVRMPCGEPTPHHTTSHDGQGPSGVWEPEQDRNSKCPKSGKREMDSNNIANDRRSRCAQKQRKSPGTSNSSTALDSLLKLSSYSASTSSTLADLCPLHPAPKLPPLFLTTALPPNHTVLISRPVLRAQMSQANPTPKSMAKSSKFHHRC